MSKLIDNTQFKDTIILKKYASQIDFENDNPFEIVKLPSELLPITKLMNSGEINVT
jgi:hypothetical protein